jgi:hypothetical protein
MTWTNTEPVDISPNPEHALGSPTTTQKENESMVNLRPADASYDAQLNEPTPNQTDVARAVFDLIQALRQEASAADPDSPGELTASEIFQQALTRVPGAAMAIMDIINDDQAIVDDIADIANVLRNQLLEQVDAPEE